MFMVSCGPSAMDQALVGNYAGKMSLRAAVDTTDVGSSMVAAYLEMSEFDFTFNKDNTLQSVMSMQSMSDTVKMTWKTKEDSLYFYEETFQDGKVPVQVYFISQTSEGYDLTDDDYLFRLIRK